MKRDTQNKLFFGVCSGIAKQYKIDPVIIRLIFGVLAFMGFGLPIIIYIVLALIMPAE
jgi:phage shock protein C